MTRRHGYPHPMPSPGKRWYHITFGTHGSWLPGDPRGFRAKHAKVYSSGDHHHPPPPGEHAELLKHSKKLQPHTVIIPKPVLKQVGQAIVACAKQYAYRINAVSVSPMHVHLLIELPTANTISEVGKMKRHASRAVSDKMPGRIWAKGCGVKTIKDQTHQVNTFNYIIKHVDHGAWVWRFRDESDEDVSG